MISNYLQIFSVNHEENTPIDLMSVASDETELVKDYLRGNVSADDLFATATIMRPLRTVNGILATSTTTYNNYFITIISANKGESSPYINADYKRRITAWLKMPDGNEHSIIVVISSIAYEQLKLNPSRIDTATMKAFGVTILASETYDDDFTVGTLSAGPSDFIESVTINGIDITASMVDRSQFLDGLVLRNDLGNNFTNGIYEIEGIIRDFYFTPKSQYTNMFISAIIIGEKNDGDLEIIRTSEFNFGSYYHQDRLYFDDYKSYTHVVILSPYTYSDFTSSPSYLNSSYAFGVTIKNPDSIEEPEPEPTEPEPLEPTDPPETPDDPTSYIESITANGGQIDLLNLMSDDTQIFLDLFVDEIYDPTKYPTAAHYLQSEIQGIELTLKEEYQDLYVVVLRLSGDENGWNHMEYFPYSEKLQQYYEWDGEINEIPFDGRNTDGIIFLISNVNFLEIEDPSEFENIFLKGWGVTFKLGDAPDNEDEDEPDLPPEPINPDDYEGQYIEVLDGTTLEHYSYVPDIYNVKIAQSINGFYTLEFNLQPYVNASNIYTPRIIFCDNDYFHVQQITKRHHLENLEMDVHCEHVSYELNYPPQAFWDEVKEDYVWTEDTYQGTASEILWELLQYNNRFSVGTVDNDITVHTFKTSTEGFRSRINEFAEQIELEVRWNKFTVSLLRKRGRDHGLTFEVGKNIVGLTEIIDTVKLGKVERSYELDVLDLNYVYDSNDAPLELHNITLGDAVTIINPNYRIQRKDRIVSITRDPFQKALPTIEFGNKIASFTSDSKKGETKASAVTPTPVIIPIYQENITRGSKGNAFGQNTQAPSDWSFAEGYYTNASGIASHSEGSVTRATGYSAHSEGSGTESSGIASHSEGQNTKAINHYAHAEGFYTTASGTSSHSEGAETTASGGNAHAEGVYTKAIGYSSHAQNSQSEASGWYSHASGVLTIANVMNSTVIGQYNKPLTGDVDFFRVTSDAFVIGNGIPYLPRSNALRIDFSGNVYAQGNFNSTGADYSEFFEWLDGNSNNDDRKGFVVTLEGDKIRLANENDNYILGIISNNPSIIGNSYEDHWNGMYLKDEWGNIQCHYADVPYDEMDEEGNKITVYRQSYVPVINPNYDPKHEYIPRSQRPEWSAVGMLGKLLVRDDGTCKINKYAKLSKTVDGILSHSDDRTQFFVLQRINENLVEVLLK